MISYLCEKCDQCDLLLAGTAPHMARSCGSTTKGPLINDVIWGCVWHPACRYRTSYGTFLRRYQDRIVERVENRVAGMWMGLVPGVVLAVMFGRRGTCAMLHMCSIAIFVHTRDRGARGEEGGRCMRGVFWLFCSGWWRVLYHMSHVV